MSERTEDQKLAEAARYPVKALNPFADMTLQDVERDPFLKSISVKARWSYREKCTKIEIEIPHLTSSIHIPDEVCPQQIDMAALAELVRERAELDLKEVLQVITLRVAALKTLPRHVS